jgi:transketolase
MRAAFLQALLEEAHSDARIILVNPDTVGFHCEAFRRELPEQYLNVGIAEQNAVGVSAGLALTGRRPSSSTSSPSTRSAASSRSASISAR